MKLEDNIVKMEEQVDKLKCEIASMKAKLKEQDKLKLKGGEGWYIHSVNGSYHAPLAHHRTVSRGAFRATKELAEQADAMMVKRNRLEAYVHQLQGNSEGEYSIYYIPQNAKYSYVANSLSFIGSVKMLESTAIKLSEALTTGEISI